MLDYLSWIDRVFIAPFYSVPGGALTTRGPGEHGAGPGDRSSEARRNKQRRIHTQGHYHQQEGKHTVFIVWHS